MVDYSHFVLDCILDHYTLSAPLVVLYIRRLVILIILRLLLFEEDGAVGPQRNIVVAYHDFLRHDVVLICGCCRCGRHLL